MTPYLREKECQNHSIIRRVCPQSISTHRSRRENYDREAQTKQGTAESAPKTSLEEEYNYRTIGEKREGRFSRMAEGTGFVSGLPFSDKSALFIITRRLQEQDNFLLTPFERNLEVWRQLWRVLERSHLVVQIVDARNPLRFRCEDLEAYVQDVEGAEGEEGTGKNKRRSLLLINKADLLTAKQRYEFSPPSNVDRIKHPLVVNGQTTLMRKAYSMRSSRLLMPLQYKKQDGQR